MEIRTNSKRAWLLAARPKTLTGAAVPVFVALCAAWHDAPSSFRWLPALLCLFFALLMQVDANLVNDYFDCVRGVDNEERLGPERACTQGWITLPAMRRGIVLTTLLSCAVGLPLVVWGGWQMVGVGAACVVFCFLYTTLLSRHALGDVLVLVFFGLVPVCATYYIQTHALTREVVLLAVASGLAIDCLLVVNNYRDRDSDAHVSKVTLVTLLGPRLTEMLYLVLGLAAAALTLPGLGWRAVGLLPYLALHLANWHRMCRIHEGRALNAVLGTTSLAILVFGLSVSTLLLA